MTNNNNRITIYQQDCEFYRYQDRFKWSRFQTLSVIEGAVLYSTLKLGLEPNIIKMIMIFGFLLIGLLCVLSLKSEDAANLHLKRIKEFEKTPNAPFPESSWPKKIKGAGIMKFAISIINIFNVIFLYLQWNS